MIKRTAKTEHQNHYGQPKRHLNNRNNLASFLFTIRERLVVIFNRGKAADYYQAENIKSEPTALVNIRKQIVHR